jgi:hypothetical protein
MTVTASAVEEALMARPQARPATPIVRTFAALLAGAMVFAACLGGASTPEATTPQAQTPAADTAPPSSGPGAASSPASEPSPYPVSSSATAATSAPGASAVSGGGATGLEQLLPDRIGGMPAAHGSMAGTVFVTSGLSTPDLGGVLARLGVGPGEIRVSYAYAGTGPSRAGVFVFRVAGASEQELRGALSAGRDQEIRGSAPGMVSIGGKPTVTIADETLPGGRSIYRYAAGSLVFFVTAGHESTAAEILAGLP